MPACRGADRERRLAFSCRDRACLTALQAAPARAAHVLQESVEKLKEAAKELNPRAKVVVTDSLVTVDDAETIRGKRVVLVEDGPTLTHGGMPYGAGESPHQALAWSQPGCEWGLVGPLVEDTQSLRPG